MFFNYIFFIIFFQCFSLMSFKFHKITFEQNKKKKFFEMKNKESSKKRFFLYFKQNPFRFANMEMTRFLQRNFDLKTKRTDLR